MLNFLLGLGVVLGIIIVASPPLSGLDWLCQKYIWKFNMHEYKERSWPARVGGGFMWLLGLVGVLGATAEVSWFIWAFGYTIHTGHWPTR